MVMQQLSGWVESRAYFSSRMPPIQHEFSSGQMRRFVRRWIQDDLGLDLKIPFEKLRTPFFLVQTYRKSYSINGKGKADDAGDSDLTSP